MTGGPALRMLVGVALMALCLYLALLAWIYFRQESLLFHPEPLPADHRFLPGEPDVHERRVEVPGASLSVLELRLPEPRGVVFFLHGNAGNLDSWFTNARFYREAGYDLVMPDYRGYGKSTGKIESEAQLRADVKAVWDAVAGRYRGKTVVVYGRSIGTGLAAGLAREIDPSLTVLVSPYCDMASLAGEHFPWVPASLLLRYPLRTCDDAAALRGPLLLVHGGLDTVIPPRHSERILERSPRSKLLRIPQAGHNDVHEFPVYVQAMKDAVAGLPGWRPSGRAGH